MGAMPTWLLWVIIVAAGLLGPFVSMLLLFLAFELVWDAADAIGIPAALSLCIGVGVGLLLGRLRPQQVQRAEA